MGEIGFIHEITNYINETDDSSLYYPNEYFDVKPVIDESFDVWSLGCVFYEIYTGDKAFTNEQDIKENKLPPFNYSKLDHCLMILIEEMLQIERKHRPKSKFILKFLVSFNVLWLKKSSKKVILVFEKFLKLQPEKFEFDNKNCIQIQNLSSSNFETRMLIRYRNNDKK